MNIIKKLTKSNSEILISLNHVLTEGQKNGLNLFKSWARYISPLQPKKLKVWGCNTRSFNNPKKQEEMLQKMLEKGNKPDIILMNETWLKKDTQTTHFFVENEDYSLISSTFDQDYQGTAILIKKSIGAISVEQYLYQNKNLSEVVVKTDLENTFSFISFYVPPDGDQTRDEQRALALEEMVNFFKRNEGKDKFMAYSDINTRLRDGDKKINQIETGWILQQIKENGVDLIYSKKEQDFTRKKSETYIDYFFSRGMQYNKFAIKDSAVDSDHLLLEIMVQPKTPVKNTFWFFVMAGLFYQYCMDNDEQIMDFVKKEFEDIEKAFDKSQGGGDQQNQQPGQKTSSFAYRQQQEEEDNNNQPENKEFRPIQYYYFIGFMYVALKVMMNQQAILRWAQNIVTYVWHSIRR